MDSQWKLVIVAKDVSARDRLIKMMSDYVLDINGDIGLRNIMKAIQTCETDRADNHVTFYADHFYCSSFWSVVIRYIEDYCNMSSDVDMAYARVQNDKFSSRQEMECGRKGWVTPKIDTVLGAFAWTIPTGKDSVQSAPVPVAQAKQEEKCRNCGKTKDAGKPCWWCGN